MAHPNPIHSVQRFTAFVSTSAVPPEIKP
jgi:hypothetical protein